MECKVPESHQQITQIQRQTVQSPSTDGRRQAMTLINSSSKCQDDETKGSQHFGSVRQVSILF